MGETNQTRLSKFGSHSAVDLSHAERHADVPVRVNESRFGEHAPATTRAPGTVDYLLRRAESPVIGLDRQGATKKPFPTK